MFGYLDAGSASVLAAAIAGGAAGIAVFVKTYWYRILGVFSPKYKQRAAETAEQLVGTAESADG